MENHGKVSLREKICYALGDASANIAWRGICAFLMIYYTDVFGLAPAVVGMLFFVVRLSDGVSDVAMGVIGDRTNSKYGKFRPWVLWTAIPLAVILSLTFTCPAGLGMTGKIIYAYLTYILFTLVYTANNIPYGALMAVMTEDDRERASIGSFRMAGAFGGGMIVQGLLLFLVAWFGRIESKVEVVPDPVNAAACTVTFTPARDVAHVDVSTQNRLACLWQPTGSARHAQWVELEAGREMQFLLTDLFRDKSLVAATNGLLFASADGAELPLTVKAVKPIPASDHAYAITVTSPDFSGKALLSHVDDNVQLTAIAQLPSDRLSVPMQAGVEQRFSVCGEAQLTAESFALVDQNRGYSYAIYALSVVLALCLFVTFFGTRERVAPPAGQRADLWKDLKDLVRNRPWIVLLVVGLSFNIYNAIRQGVTVYYFSHFIHRELLVSGFFTALMIASILGALATAPLARRFGKKKVFIATLLLAGAINLLFACCGPTQLAAIFVIGFAGEAVAAVFPTLFFTMLGDAADYSEYTNGRRATGLVYSAGSFATKFGGGIAGVIIGLVLASYNYVGTDPATIEGAIPGIRLLMGVIPSAVAVVTAALMFLYPLSDRKLSEITAELANRRT